MPAHYFYWLVQASENGRTKRLPKSYYTIVSLLDGVPNSLEARATNAIENRLQPVGPKRWKLSEKGAMTKMAVYGKDLENEYFFFSILWFGTLTFSYDFKNLTATTPWDDRKLHFRLED